MFTSIATGEDLSSNLVGLDIYNANQQKIGTVKDIAMSDGHVNAYIVGVGGFLGIGDHYVAVKPSAVAITYGATDKKWRATMDTNAAALKAAPEYKYAS
jgi:sporulation protein YlmC with PRC-barrel domain